MGMHPSVCVYLLQDKEAVASFCSSTLGQELATQELAIAGETSQNVPDLVQHRVVTAVAWQSCHRQKQGAQRHQQQGLPACQIGSVTRRGLLRVCAGRNWGDVDINSSSLLYRVDNKALFEVPLPDVSQAQQTKVSAQPCNTPDTRL
jgi:hypothetical protein